MEGSVNSGLGDTEPTGTFSEVQLTKEGDVKKGSPSKEKVEFSGDQKCPDTGATSSSSSNVKGGACAKLRWLLSTAVAEPFFILFMFSTSCRALTFTTLINDKVCNNDLNYGEVICNIIQGDNHALKDLHKKEMLTVQRWTNNIVLGHTLMTMIPSIVAVIFLGSFSDKYGRKMPVMLASLGMLLEIAGIVICVLDHKSSATLLLLTSVPAGLFGGMMLALIAMVSYLSETTSAENRPLRFAFMEMAFYVASPAGTALGGVIYDQFGYVAVFSMSFVTLLLAMIWIMVKLKEPNKPPLVSVKQTAKEMFSLENVKENFRTCTKKRTGNVRMQIWLLFLSASVQILSMIGTLGITLMFVQLMYGWKNLQLSIVNAVTSVLQALAVGISVPLLTKVLKAHDSILIIVGCLCSCGSLLIKSLSYVAWMYVLACFAGLFSGLTSIGIRSRISRLVSQKEIGKVFSVMMMLESLTPLFGSLIGSQIYNGTVSFYPGMVFLVFSILLIAPLIVATWIYKSCPDPPESREGEEILQPDEPLEESISKI